ncbi:MAG TPA: bifunctional phosphoribosylaminoimidazolecarboxamide formyltransferase/IMP cyclohydrolase [Chloroflexia bacterium]|nr:bifunctional phosphoribosylaminoimidazolecarboxamide formyltransferase/IMP cyclohydrolase [Chloroflexia bacterium]
MQGERAAVNAIVSVSDPAHLDVLGAALARLGASVYATGGTQVKLAKAGVQAQSVSALTGFPEILGGRVKTLHPGVHSGILARRDDPGQMAQLTEHGLKTIDLVAVNLYPFARTIQQEGVTLPEAVEQIDVGGPAMIRAAAKNFASVVVLSDPADYAPVMAEWEQNGSVSHDTRKRLAAKAFRHVSEYDALIAGYLGDESQAGETGQPAEDTHHNGRAAAEESTPISSLIPPEISLELRRVQRLRYGENPHQVAALYSDNLPVGGATLVGSLQQLHGPELSYNNLMDADAALALVRDYAMPAVAIIKHAGPCGIATGGENADLAEVFSRALASDPVSAFGGIVGINRPVDGRLAEHLAKVRFDVLVAPAFSEEAVDMLARKRNLRLLAVPDANNGRRDDDYASRLAFRQVSGGFLVQTRDAIEEDLHMEPVTLRHPTLEEIADMLFAWRAAKHVRSNAIVLAKELATVGIGGGQTSRVDSVRIAAEKAGKKAQGAVMASDAFFPFPDGLEVAAAAGVTAVIQPGGSVNDDAVIEAADTAGLAMVFTRKRHFRH